MESKNYTKTIFTQPMTNYRRLIAYGDSFVHGDGLRTRDHTKPFWEQHSPEAWPHLLGNKLQISNIINRGVQGASNFHSAHQMLRDVGELNINQTDLVYVLLTKPKRIPIPMGCNQPIYRSNLHYRSARAMKFLNDVNLIHTPVSTVEAWTLDAHNLISIIQNHTGCTLRIFWGWLDIRKDEFPQLYDMPVDINQKYDDTIVSLTVQLGLWDLTYKTECGHWNELGHQRVAEHIFEYEQIEKANGSEAVSR